MGKRLLLILSLFVLADIYFFQVIQTVFQNVNVYRAYWSIDVLLFGAVFLLLYLRRSGYEIEKMMAAVLNSFFIVFIPKFIAVPFLLVEDFVRLFQGFPSRSLWLSELVLFLALVLVVVIVFGLTNGRHYYKVREEVLRFPFLPEEFDGFKITQISDIHSGSLSDIKGVRKGIALANAQNSDLLLFTGDKKVDLTLAGHTHGMQFGFELFGFKWSPIQYFYKQWAGLYQQDEKYLYVNRGFGYHGLKGRIGVWPEITVITLKKSQE